MGAGFRVSHAVGSGHMLLASTVVSCVRCVRVEKQGSGSTGFVVTPMPDLHVAKLVGGRVLGSELAVRGEGG